MKTIHQAIVILIYSTILIGLIHWAYQGPSDVELRIRASEPIAR